MEGWVEEADLDAVDVVYVTTPDTFKEVVSLLISRLGWCYYPAPPDTSKQSLTCSERVFGKGLKEPRADHIGSRQINQP